MQKSSQYNNNLQKQETLISPQHKATDAQNTKLQRSQKSLGLLQPNDPNGTSGRRTSGRLLSLDTNLIDKLEEVQDQLAPTENDVKHPQTGQQRQKMSIKDQYTKSVCSDEDALIVARATQSLCYPSE